MKHADKGYSDKEKGLEKSSDKDKDKDQDKESGKDKGLEKGSTNDPLTRALREQGYRAVRLQGPSSSDHPVCLLTVGGRYVLAGLSNGRVNVNDLSTGGLSR